MRLSALVFGAATFSHFYNSEEYLSSSTPTETVEAALQHGILAFDTSAYYGNSEIILGSALQTLKCKFPRPLYQLMTKCGRYGLHDFDYSPARIRHTVEQSLTRLQTDYLDVVYLHDVEFVATSIGPITGGNHLDALGGKRSQYGLAKGGEAMVRGEGDQKIIDALEELRRLQERGLVKHVGISGYPLPILLRVALLVLNTPPYKPLDVVLSYGQLTLQNTTFTKFSRELREQAQVRQMFVASPFGMGLLTPSPPLWHPAPDGLKVLAGQASNIWPGGLANLALGFALRNAAGVHGVTPVVVGFSTPFEVHECVTVWKQQQNGELVDCERQKAEELVQDLFKKAGYLDWSWE